MQIYRMLKQMMILLPLRLKWLKCKCIYLIVVYLKTLFQQLRLYSVT
jgi:hypothetical protein